MVKFKEMLLTAKSPAGVIIFISSVMFLRQFDLETAAKEKVNECQHMKYHKTTPAGTNLSF